jgi:hypothetical protein
MENTTTTAPATTEYRVVTEVWMDADRCATPADAALAFVTDLLDIAGDQALCLAIEVHADDGSTRTVHATIGLDRDGRPQLVADADGPRRHDWVGP